MKLSPFERALRQIDHTPDGGYALRILRVFRDECGSRLHGLKAERVAELDKAIETLLAETEPGAPNCAISCDDKELE